MSWTDLEEANLLIKQNFNDSEIDCNRNQSLNTIQNAEKALGIKFPHTYIKFLKDYGWWKAEGYEIYGLIKDEDFLNSDIPSIGIPNVVHTTLQWHRDYGHPLYLPIIYNLGEGTVYCLDTSQMNSENECPVVVWPISGYKGISKLEIEAEDFSKFFLKTVQQAIEYKNGL